MKFLLVGRKGIDKSFPSERISRKIAALLAISDCQNLRCRRTVERAGSGGVHTERWIAFPDGY